MKRRSVFTLSHEGWQRAVSIRLKKLRSAGAAPRTRRRLVIARVVCMIGVPAVYGCGPLEAASDQDEMAPYDGEPGESGETPADIAGISSAATEATWTRCANEFAYCNFSGLRDVRLRTADGRSVTKEYFQNARCAADAAGFGVDPAPRVGKFCEMGPAKVRTLPAPDMAHGPAINLTQIPRGFSGFAEFRVQRNATAPRKDTIGAFRTVCSLSHMNFDDPLLYPGNPGAAHLHAFFGNTLINASSNATSIANTGNGTCRGGIANRTAYWIPALIDTRNGKPLTPFEAHFYYKTGYAGIAPSAVNAFPKGLRMIAGDMKSSGPQQVVTWGCIDGNKSGSSIQNCGVGQQVQFSVTFPQCWNGKDLDSTNHKSHMAYPANGRCPTTHPRPIPEISFHIRYKVEEANAPTYWRLSSDMYSTSLPGGYSGHADWWDGWDEGVKNAWIKGCSQKSLDCFSNLLGDGREIF